MKLRIRLILCVAMTLFAAVMARAALSSLSAGGEAREFQGYILGESQGRVAVFDALDRESPLTVTDIELSSLREGDQSLLRMGIQTDTAEELAQLLEDLGS